MKNQLAIGLLATTIICASAAHAAIVTPDTTYVWDVNASDASNPADTLTGYIDYDTATNAVTKYSLTGQGGSLAGFSVNSANGTVNNFTFPVFDAGSATNRVSLSVLGADGPTSLPGLSNLPVLSLANSFALPNEVNFENIGSVITLAGDMNFVGSVADVSSVPLPAAAPMFLAGLLGLAAFGWRKRASA
jgi:hypothetical protein